MKTRTGSIVPLPVDMHLIQSGNKREKIKKTKASAMPTEMPNMDMVRGGESACGFFLLSFFLQASYGQAPSSLVRR
jgi:hypothetical protein